jgi:hypothetical protein
MVRPAQRRAFVKWSQDVYGISERRSCRLVRASRSSMRYRSVRPRQEPLRARLRELAGVRVRSGYRQLHTFLRREGHDASLSICRRCDIHLARGSPVYDLRWTPSGAPLARLADLGHRETLMVDREELKCS